MKLQPRSEHPRGLSDKDFDVLFTTDKPVIFAYHGLINHDFNRRAAVTGRNEIWRLANGLAVERQPQSGW